LFQLVGFEQRAVELTKSFKRSTSYSFTRRAVAAIDAITSLSVAPLFYLCSIGLSLVVLCVIASVLVVIQRLAFGIAVEGWTTLVIGSTLLGGFIIFAQGVIGIYVGKIYLQVKQRPLYIVESSTLDDGALESATAEPVLQEI